MYLCIYMPDLSMYSIKCCIHNKQKQEPSSKVPTCVSVCVLALCQHMCLCISIVSACVCVLALCQCVCVLALCQHMCLCISIVSVCLCISIVSVCVCVLALCPCMCLYISTLYRLHIAFWVCVHVCLCISMYTDFTLPSYSVFLYLLQNDKT